MLIQFTVLLLLVSSALSLGDGQYYSKKSAKQASRHHAAIFSEQQKISPVAFKTEQQVAAAPSPYSFQYQAEAGRGQSSREEYGDASGKVVGSYSVVNEDGSKRLVKYVADAQGFRADVDTNEPGTKSDSPADIRLNAAPAPVQQYAAVAQQKAYQAPVAQQKAYQAPVAQQKAYQAPVAQQKAYQAHVAPQRAYQAHVAPQRAYQAPVQKPIRFSTKTVAGVEEEQPKPYSFSYQNQMQDAFSAHSESADGSGKVVGSYSLSQEDGRQRTVDYSADQNGFKADVQTNEFGTKSDSPADVRFLSLAEDAFPQKSQQAYQAPAVQQIKFNDQIPMMQFQAAGVPAKQQDQKAHQYGEVSQKKVEFQQPSPYAFNYYAQLEDGSSSRNEAADASGKVVGSYSLAVADGRQRTVEYTAGHEGFVAKVNTNEFGTKSESPADVLLYSSAPQPAPEQQQAPVAFMAPPQYQPEAARQVASKSYQQAFQIEQKQQPIQFNMQQGAALTEDRPIPYSFGYKNQMDGGSSAHSEASDGYGKVVGSYSLSHNNGLQRTVEYTADEGGFRAAVKTNEFGTKSNSPADVQMYSTAPEPQLPIVSAKTQIPQMSQVSLKAPMRQQSAGFQNAAFHSQKQQVFPMNTPLKEEKKNFGFSRSTAKQAAFNAKVAKQEPFAGQVKLAYEAPAVVEFQKSAAPIQQQAQEMSFPRYPYSFGYEAHATGGSSSRQESSDSSGKVTGSYSVTNEDGSSRLVEYIADEGGFRANVKTSEPGTKSDSPAHVVLNSNAPSFQQAAPAPLRNNFPVKSYAPKTSEISQKAIDAWSR